MKTLAIIAEYNPFHNGHQYHIQQSKAVTNSDYTIALMSGNFLQRGCPAILDKYSRGRLCAIGGVDLTIELPFPYATGSAMDFSIGAVSLLDKLNTVDYLCFGAECNNITMFEKIADVLLEEPDSYIQTLKDCLSQGMSFPAARQKALSLYLKDFSLDEFVSSPNNILGIEYVTALKRRNSKIKPIPIQRKNAGYHDTTIYSSISSATALRQAFHNEDNPIDAISNDIPAECLSTLKEAFNYCFPIYDNDLTPFLQSALMTNESFDHIWDINSDLSNKLKALAPSVSYTDSIEILKSRDITSTRIARSIIHLIMNYTSHLHDIFTKNDYAFYGNILSLRKDSSSLVKDINSLSSIPLINKKADFSSTIASYDIDKDIANTMWALDTKATNLYNCLIFNRYNIKAENDYTIRLPII